MAISIKIHVNYPQKDLNTRKKLGHVYAVVAPISNDLLNEFISSKETPTSDENLKRIQKEYPGAFRMELRNLIGTK